MRDIYPPSHWAIRGTPPAFDTPDEDVYLVGRNVVLLTKAALSAATERIPRVAIGPLVGNPFPDATPQFFDAMANALTLGLAHHIEILAPFAEMDKADVIKLGVALGVDLSLTLSCMNPQNGLHCGRCSKCRERRDAFAEAGVPDPTHRRADRRGGGAGASTLPSAKMAVNRVLVLAAGPLRSGRWREGLQQFRDGLLQLAIDTGGLIARFSDREDVHLTRVAFHVLAFMIGDADARQTQDRSVDQAFAARVDDPARRRLADDWTELQRAVAFGEVLGV